MCSTGTIEELPPNDIPGTLEFPAKIDANLCLQIDTDPDTIFGLVENCPASFLPVNREPLHVECDILSLTEAQCTLGSARFFDTTGAEKANVLDADAAMVQISNIGGVAELPDVAASPAETGGSSAPGVARVTTIAAAVVIALGGAAWYARRRRLT